MHKTAAESFCRRGPSSVQIRQPVVLDVTRTAPDGAQDLPAATTMLTFSANFMIPRQLRFNRVYLVIARVRRCLDSAGQTERAAIGAARRWGRVLYAGPYFGQVSVAARKPEARAAHHEPGPAAYSIVTGFERFYFGPERASRYRACLYLQRTGRDLEALAQAEVGFRLGRPDLDPALP